MAAAASTPDRSRLTARQWECEDNMMDSGSDSDYGPCADMSDDSEDVDIYARPFPGFILCQLMDSLIVIHLSPVSFSFALW